MVEQAPTEQGQHPEVGWTEALGAHAQPQLSQASMANDTLHALELDWHVSGDEGWVKAQFEQWVRRGAKQAITEADSGDMPEEAALMRSAYSADFGKGFYGWDGRHCRDARGDVPGLRRLLYLLLYKHHHEGSKQPVTEVMVEDMFAENLSVCVSTVMVALGNFPTQQRRKKLRDKTAKAKLGAANGTTTATAEPPTLGG